MLVGDADAGEPGIMEEHLSRSQHQPISRKVHGIVAGLHRDVSRLKMRPHCRRRVGDPPMGECVRSEQKAEIIRDGGKRLWKGGKDCQAQQYGKTHQENRTSLALGETHRRYTGFVNARMRVTGHLFQGRFGSVALDEPHLIAAARYVALNPVRARLVRRAQDWPWSSARAHLKGRDDGLVTVAPLIERTARRFADLLDEGPTQQELAALRAAETIGRPLGSPAFLDRLEVRLGRSVRASKRGRPKRES